MIGWIIGVLRADLGLKSILQGMDIGNIKIRQTDRSGINLAKYERDASGC